MERVSIEKAIYEEEVHIFERIQTLEKCISSIKQHLRERAGPSTYELFKEADVNKTLKVFPCQICGKIYTNGQKLGGHASRAHKKKPK